MEVTLSLASKVQAYYTCFEATQTVQVLFFVFLISAFLEACSWKFFLLTYCLTSGEHDFCTSPLVFLDAFGHFVNLRQIIECWCVELPLDILFLKILGRKFLEETSLDLCSRELWGRRWLDCVQWLVRGNHGPGEGGVLPSPPPWRKKKRERLEVERYVARCYTRSLLSVSLSFSLSPFGHIVD